MKKFIQSLSADEASRVLKCMLDNDPALMEKAYEAAVGVAGDVDADIIMDRVFCSLDWLDLDCGFPVIAEQLKAVVDERFTIPVS